MWNPADDDPADDENVRQQLSFAEGRRDIYIERLKSNKLSAEDRRYFEQQLRNVETELEGWRRILKR